MQHISIPRWLLIAMAALLAIVIFVILVHPYLDVSNATVGERMLTLAIAALLTLLPSVVPAPASRHVSTAEPASPQPLPIVDRTCIRRI